MPRASLALQVQLTNHKSPGIYPARLRPHSGTNYPRKSTAPGTGLVLRITVPWKASAPRTRIPGNLSPHAIHLSNPLWEGNRESRRCSRDTYPESNTTKYTSIRRKKTCVSRRRVQGNKHPNLPDLKYALSGIAGSLWVTRKADVNEDLAKSIRIAKR